MPDIRPTALREHVLRAVGDLSGMTAGKAVKASDVVAKTLDLVGVGPSDPDHEKAARNANWVGTQTMREQGLLGPADKRGWWVLLPAGLAALGGDAVPAPSPAAPPPAEEEDAPPTPRPTSPWEDDKAGVVVFTSPTRDTYPTDEYLRALAIAQTVCFGAFVEDDPTCGTCPISGVCRTSRFTSLHKIGEALTRRDELEAARRAPKATPSAPVAVTTSDDSLDDVIADLEVASPSSRRGSGLPPSDSAAAVPADENGITMPAAAETLCYNCGGKIPEGAKLVMVVGRGGRHEKCP